MESLKTLSVWLLFAAAWGLGITVTFLAWNTAPAAAGVAVQFAAAALFLGLFYGKQTSRLIETLIREWKSGRREEPVRVAGMTAALSMGYLLMVVKRYGYAPSGSDIVFLLALVPVFVAVITWLSRAAKPTLGTVAGGAAALLGGIAIVGNWERPSSFSPFSRFPLEEMVLVLAAVLIAWFFVLLWRVPKERSVAGTMTLTVWLSVPILLIAARIFSGWSVFIELTLENYLVLAACGLTGVALPLLILSGMTEKFSVTRASSAIYLSPVIVTLMIGVEKSSGALGAGIMPTPFLWAPVIAGIVITVTGVAAIWGED